MIEQRYLNTLKMMDVEFVSDDTERINTYSVPLDLFNDRRQNKAILFSIMGDQHKLLPTPS